MPFSTCCGAHTNYPEYDLCPDCLEHCDWEEEDEEEVKEDKQSEEQLEQIQINQKTNL